jgi:hypothetical protein
MHLPSCWRREPSLLARKPFVYSLFDQPLRRRITLPADLLEAPISFFSEIERHLVILDFSGWLGFAAIVLDSALKPIAHAWLIGWKAPDVPFSGHDRLNLSNAKLKWSLQKTPLY